MLGTLRGFANTWPARIFFLILAGAFALWGVANKNPFGADPTSLATVGGQKIGMQEAQQAFRKQLAQIQQSMGGKADIPPQLRRMAAIQTVEQLVSQAALQARVNALGLVVPDSALRDAAFAIPQFRGRDGRYDHATMLAVLRQNGYTEDSFLDLLRRSQAQEQLLGAVRAGAHGPKLLGEKLFSFMHETRVAQAVDFPFSAAPTLPAPTEAQLRRWYDNHPAQYSSPEYRKIKAAVLSPETVSKDISVSDEDVRAAYDQHKAEYNTPARRWVQVLTVPNLVAAEKLDQQWIAGADWATMQKAAQDAGATSVALDAATRAEFPAPELADAAFATNLDTVAPVARGSLGWYVVKVTKADPGGTQTLASATPALRARLVAEKASDLVDQRSVKVDDLLQGGTGLDDLPGDLGLAGTTGTLDAKGNTPAGTPAPIPGSAELRAALFAAAFQAHKGDPLKLQQGPPSTGGVTNSYFAVSVEDILPPAPRPYDTVRGEVRADWMRDARRQQQDAAAAKLMTAVQGGAGLSDAAKAAGGAVRALPAVGRFEPVNGVPQSLVAPLFGMRQGEATMVETPDGFMVVTLSAINRPEAKADPIGYARLQEQIDQQLAGDIQGSFAVAARDAAKPRINQSLLDQLAQPGD